MTSAQRLACAVIRNWTRVYTWALPAEIAMRRRAEIESDLWESVTAAESADAPAADAVHLLGRAIRSIWFDICWRVEVTQAPARVHVVSVLVAMAILGVGSLVLVARLVEVGPLPDVPRNFLEVNLGPLAAPPPPPPPPSLRRLP